MPQIEKTTKEKLLEEFDNNLHLFITQSNCNCCNIMGSGHSLAHLNSKELKNFLSKAIDQTRGETLKELIREYQDNELDGKEYDFYFSIRSKIKDFNKNNH